MRLILIACLLSIVKGQATDGDEQCCNLVEFMGHVIIQRNQPLTTELSSLVDFLSFKLCDDSPFVVQLWKPSALTEGEDDSLCAPENSYTLLWEKTITPDSSLIAGQWYKVILEEKITLHPDYRLGFASVNGQSEVLSVPYMIPTSLASSLKAVAIDDKAFSTYSPGDSMCAVTLNNAKSFDTFTLFCKEEIDDQGEVVSECYNSNIIPPATVVGPPGPPGPPGADGKDGEPGPPGIPGECCQDWSFDQTLKPSCDLGDSFVTTMNDIKAELESVSQKLENGQGISTGLSSGVCPGQSWIPGSFGLGNCYIPLFDADEAQWAETMFNCVDLLDDKDEDVYVIDIISEVENNFLVSQILKLMPPADQLKKTESWSVWTSAMFSEKENSWLWRVSSKEQFPFHYYNWRDNKPPEPESTIPKNNCVVLVVERDPDGAERNFWEVRHCKEKARTMCKIPKKCH